VREAILALGEYLTGQGVELSRSPLTETFERVNVNGIPLIDMTSALQRALPLVEQGGAVSLTFADEDQLMSFRSAGPDQWRLDGPAEVFSDELAGEEERGRWSSDELARFTPRSIDTATCNIELDKKRWSEPLSAALSRQVWIGISGAAFVEWMRRSTWEGSARVLFAKPGALVLLNDWTDGPVIVGKRLTVGDLDTRAEAPPNGPTWPEPVDLPLLCAIDVEVPADEAQVPEGDVRRPLAGMATAVAAWLLSEVRDGEVQRGLRVRPSRSGTTTWTIPGDPHMVHTTIPVVQLARWVTQSANATRLTVARHVAAERISDPFDVAPPAVVVTAAEIAYQSAVDAHVQSALGTQLELERSFQEVDAKVAAIRDDIRTAVDQTVVRALTASLGIAVASLTVSDVRGWPTVLAAGAVAAYVLFTAWWTLRTMRADVGTRFVGLHNVIKQRELGLGTGAIAAIEAWRNALRRRIRWAQLGLTVLAASVAIGGMVSGATLH
jgi:hypothetical protein